MIARSLIIKVICVVCGGISVGCGNRSDLDFGQVSGIVTLNNAPLANAQVLFRPEKGRPSSDITDENGRYELQFTIKRSGALVGAHEVLISTAIDGADDTRAKELVPAKYNKATELTCDVQPGENTFNFELSK